MKNQIVINIYDDGYKVSHTYDDKYKMFKELINFIDNLIEEDIELNDFYYGEYVEINVRR